VGNVTGVQKTPAAQRAVGLGLGVVVLALLVGLAVGLPKAEGASTSEVAELPTTLPGGWTATDAVDPADAPEGSGVDADAIEAQAEQVVYAEKAYAEVYDPAPHYRVYTDDSLQRFVLVTIFAGESSAFLPDSPPVDPQAIGAERSGTELVREGDALCSVSYQLVAAGEDAGEPTAVTCQRPVDGQTLQVQAQGVTLDDTFAFLDELAAAVS
jgi:hypothetical protein